MSKDLPYFKFFPSEWLSGNITLEEYETQGMFINICAYYWSRKCDVSIDELKRRFKGGLSLVEACLKGGFLGACEGGKISISFLDEQYEDLNKKNTMFSEAGKLGALRKKELREQATLNTTLKPPLSLPLSIKEEEKKKKKNKRDSIFLPPSLNEVREYFKEKGYKQEIADKAFSGYDVANWFDSKGNKVLNWKQKMINVWFKPEHKISETVKKMQL